MLLFSVFLVGASVSAQPQQSASTETIGAEEEAEVDPEQRVRCRTRRVTGSNARRVRTCLTIAQWRDLARDGNRDARDVLRLRGDCPTPDAGC
ncbi:MAG: hypothetical protein AAFW97_16945 [Pseudomonadota bacterium]